MKVTYDARTDTLTFLLRDGTQAVESVASSDLADRAAS